MKIYDAIINEQGQIAIPEQLLDSLEDSCLSDGRLTVVMIPNFHFPCLEIYPLAEWKKGVEEPLPTLSEGHQEKLRKIIDRTSIHCQVDEDGKIKITDAMIDHACLTHECLFAQYESKFQLWDRNSYLAEHG